MHLAQRPKRYQGPAECRYYWQDGQIVDTEWWLAGRLLLVAPSHPSTRTTVAHHCAIHGARIFADLPCPYCGERAPVSPAAPCVRRSMHGASSLPPVR